MFKKDTLVNFRISTIIRWNTFFNGSINVYKVLTSTSTYTLVKRTGSLDIESTTLVVIVSFASVLQRGLINRLTCQVLLKVLID